MHIVNMMLSSGSGGIEQAFVDYCEGLAQRGHRVTPITPPKADVNAALSFRGFTPVHLHNYGEWDFLARAAFKRQLKKLKPDVVMTQTHRSFILAQRGAKGLCPLVGVAHNYNARARRFAKGDAVFATTPDLIRFVAEKGVPQERIFLIPNMVRCEALPARQRDNAVPVIGAMGRMVEKKGFDVFIDALQLLHRQGFVFKAVLGGTGAESAKLKKRSHAAGLDNILSFVGWVEGKKAFYKGLDIFCLPSLHEPFGIVLLEAFTFGTPVVSTDSEGPHDIITPNYDGLMVERGNAQALAIAMAQLLKDPEMAARLAANGFVKVKTLYSMESVSERIEQALEKITARWQQEHRPT